MFISNENRKVLKIENDARTQHITIEENATGEIKATGVGPDLGDGVGYGLVTIIDDEVTTEIDPYFPNYAFGDWNHDTNLGKYDFKNPAHISVTVIFDGVIYENVLNNGFEYDLSFGATYNDDDDTYDWSNYPFEFTAGSFITKTAGTHTIKVIASVVKNKIPTTIVDYPFVRFRGSAPRIVCNLTFDEVVHLYDNAFTLGFNVLVFYDDKIMDLAQFGDTNLDNAFVFVFHDYSVSNNVVQDKEFKQLTFKPDGTITVSTIS